MGGSTGHGLRPVCLCLPCCTFVCLLASTDLYKPLPLFHICSAAVCPAYPGGFVHVYAVVRLWWVQPH